MSQQSETYNSWDLLAVTHPTTNWLVCGLEKEYIVPRSSIVVWLSESKLFLTASSAGSLLACSFIQLQKSKEYI